jgi:hypothetical protein
MMVRRAAMIRDQEGKFTVVTALLIVAVVVVAAAAPLVFVKFRPVTVDEERSVVANGSGRVHLQVMATVGEVEILFLPLDGDAVRVRATIRGLANAFGEASPLQLGLESENVTDEQGEVQRVNATLDTYAPWPTYSLRQVNYTITVNESLRARLNLSVTTGGIALSTSAGTVLEGLEVNSTVKGAVISLNNGTVLAGNVRIQTATGGTVLSWNGVMVEGDRDLTMVESSGPITAHFTQDGTMNGRVSVVARDTVGKIQMLFDLTGPVSAEVVCVWGLGEPTVIDRGGFAGDAELFRSHNHPDESAFRAEANSTIGNIYVEGRWE